MTDAVLPAITPANAGPLLQRLRWQRGMTQAQVAKRCGITPAAVCMIENGVNHPRPETLRKILAALGEQKGEG